MQDQLFIHDDQNGTPPGYSLDASVAAVMVPIASGDTTYMGFLATIKGLAAHTERLAMGAMTAAKRSASEDKDLESLAQEMHSLARRTENAIAGILAAMNGSSQAVAIADHTAVGFQARGEIAGLTEQESALYERHMSKGARDIAEVIGMPSTVLLIAKCGGSTIRPFGKELAFLYHVLGVEAATKLKKWLGAAPLSVPACASAKRAVIHSRIRAEFDRMTTVEKLTARDAVRNLANFASPQIGERHVWRILKGSDEPSNPVTKKRQAGSPDTAKGRVHRLK